MAINFTTVAFVGVIMTGLTLFSIGQRVGAPAPSPTTPKNADPSVFTLTSVSVDLPAGNSTFPAGPGVEVMNGNCTGCHSAGMVTTQPKLAKAAWEGEVNKMIQVYKAPVDRGDVPAIMGYLEAVK